VRTLFHGLFDGSGEVQWGEVTRMVVLEDREDKALASWCDPDDRPARLPEHQAGDVRAVR
jgi:hypothetical protein